VIRGGTHPEPVRVMPRDVAHTLERLMVGVVDYGTGTAASLAPIGVAGKTGTAELEDTTDDEDEDVEQTPGSDTDAWFTSYAPVKKPKIAVAVLLVRNGAGGGCRRLAARVVLQAALAD
jgi:peptidoglycan glycosyltransferase